MSRRRARLPEHLYHSAARLNRSVARRSVDDLSVRSQLDRCELCRSFDRVIMMCFGHDQPYKTVPIPCKAFQTVSKVGPYKTIPMLMLNKNKLESAMPASHRPRVALFADRALNVAINNQSRNRSMCCCKCPCMKLERPRRMHDHAFVQRQVHKLTKYQLTNVLAQAQLRARCMYAHLA